MFRLLKYLNTYINLSFNNIYHSFLNSLQLLLQDDYNELHDNIQTNDQFKSTNTLTSTSIS